MQHLIILQKRGVLETDDTAFAFSQYHKKEA